MRRDSFFCHFLFTNNKRKDEEVIPSCHSFSFPLLLQNTRSDRLAKETVLSGKRKSDTENAIKELEGSLERNMYSS